MKKIIQFGYVTGLIGFLTFHMASAQTAQTKNKKTGQAMMGIITQTDVGNLQIPKNQQKQIEKMEKHLLKKRETSLKKREKRREKQKKRVEKLMMKGL